MKLNFPIWSWEKSTKAVAFGREISVTFQVLECRIPETTHTKNAHFDRPQEMKHEDFASICYRKWAKTWNFYQNLICYSIQCYEIEFCRSNCAWEKFKGSGVWTRNKRHILSSRLSYFKLPKMNKNRSQNMKFWSKSNLLLYPIKWNLRFKFFVHVLLKSPKSSGVWRRNQRHISSSRISNSGNYAYQNVQLDRPLERQKWQLCLNSFPKMGKTWSKIIKFSSKSNLLLYPMILNRLLQLKSFLRKVQMESGVWRRICCWKKTSKISKISRRLYEQEHLIN